MDKKLTLSLNERVIAKAKDYAKGNNISLSRMIENYLSALVEESTARTEETTFTPLVDRLIGVVDLPNNAEEHYKEEYTEYLSNKYK